MAVYIKNPVYVEAVRFVRLRTKPVCGFDWSEDIKGTSFGDALDEVCCGRNFERGGSLYVYTKEGEKVAWAGDWIVRDAEGNFYPSGPEEFDANYLKVSPQ